MLRMAYHAAAGLLALAALAAAAAALAPVAPASGARGLVDSLLVLRDGHGARPVPQPDELSRRNP